MYVIVYDFGTSAVKTCLFDIGTTIRLVCHTTAEYGLYILDNGGWKTSKVMKRVYRESLRDVKKKEAAKINKHFEKLMK